MALGGVGPEPAVSLPSPVGVWGATWGLWPGTCLQLGLPVWRKAPGCGAGSGEEGAPAAWQGLHMQCKVMVLISGAGLGSTPGQTIVTQRLVIGTREGPVSRQLPSIHRAVLQ